MDQIVGLPSSVDELDVLVTNYNKVAIKHDVLVAENLKLRSKVAQLEARLKKQSCSTSTLPKPTSNLAKSSRKFFVYLQTVKRNAKDRKEKKGEPFTKNLERMIERMAANKWENLTTEERARLCVE